MRGLKMTLVPCSARLKLALSRVHHQSGVSNAATALEWYVLCTPAFFQYLNNSQRVPTSSTAVQTRSGPDLSERCNSPSESES
jgi:hypothetical protein